MQNINQYQYLFSQKTPHTSPLRASFGVSIVKVFAENWPCYNGTALYHSFMAATHLGVLASQYMVNILGNIMVTSTLKQGSEIFLPTVAKVRIQSSL